MECRFCENRAENIYVLFGPEISEVMLYGQCDYCKTNLLLVGGYTEDKLEIYEEDTSAKR